MRSELLIFALISGVVTNSAKLPEITSYAKVTKNGEETEEKKNHPSDTFSWIINAFSTPNTTKLNLGEGRSNHDISITVSPVYVAPKIPELNKGEAVDYPPTKSYSTLDEEMISQIDAQSRRNQISAQERFHPPASFQHDVAHANAAKNRLKQSSNSQLGPSGPPINSLPPSPPYPPPPSLGSPSPSSSSSSATGPEGYSSPIFSSSYDYKSPTFSQQKPKQKPTTVDGYPSPDSFPKAPSSFDSSISFQPPSDDYPPDHDPELTHEIQASDYGSKPVYTRPKAIEYAGHFDNPAYVDHDPYISDHHPHHHHEEDIIYDHIPYDHTTTTMAPEQMDKRLSKRPYSYYFIGKKLWYIPLYFSIYFIFYIAALILKSISRHKINFPTNLHNALDHDGRNFQNKGPGWMDLTFKVLDGIERVRNSLSKKL